MGVPFSRTQKHDASDLHPPPWMHVVHGVHPQMVDGRGASQGVISRKTTWKTIGKLRAAGADILAGGPFLTNCNRSCRLLNISRFT